VIARDREEYNFLIDGWVSKDMPSDFTEYFDLRESASRNTGYNGQRVWRFIHTNLCFQKRLQQEEMGWKRDFNRLISGMHAVVDCEIIEDIGLSEEGRCEYRRRLRDEPGSILNLYYAYMLTLSAIREVSKGPSFKSCAYLGDASLPPLMRALASDDLLASDSVQTPVDAGTQVPYLPRSPQISRPRWREADLCLPSSAREYGQEGLERRT